MSTCTRAIAPIARLRAGAEIKVRLSATGLNIKLFSSMTFLICSDLIALLLKQVRVLLPLQPNSFANFSHAEVDADGFDGV
jgi:hypothetical protein